MMQDTIVAYMLIKTIYYCKKIKMYKQYKRTLSIALYKLFMQFFFIVNLISLCIQKMCKNSKNNLLIIRLSLKIKVTSGL